jgi:hypothetical protein
MPRFHRSIRIAAVFACTALLPWAAMADSYQQFPTQSAPPIVVQQQALSPHQLNNLVAPITLYPDPLLGQLLAASTYPLELVEAQQWLQQNRNLKGQALVDAARQQDWDPGVQMLVAFPDVVALLNRDIRWTTDLGNAFLTQQADVMNAIQTLRMQAQNNGRLATTPQQVVTDDVQNGQTAVRIEPANPQVVYPPVYDPAYVWGSPSAGAYPQVYYPGAYGGYGYGFGSGVNIAGLFSGLLNWGSWGWVLGWFTHSLSLASLFFNILGFHGFGGGYGGAGFHAGGVGAYTAWAHNPSHRLGVPYPRGFAASHNAGYAYRSPQVAGFEGNSYRNTARSVAPPARPASTQNSAPRYMAANPQTQHYSQPKYSEPKYSAPKYSAPKTPKFSAPKAPHFSAPKNSGGGHSAKNSHKR